MHGISLCLYKSYLRFFLNLTKIQQCKLKPGETVLAFFEHFEDIFKQYSGLSLDSFKSHQNDPLPNLAFLEGLDEEFVTLIKQHELTG